VTAAKWTSIQEAKKDLRDPAARLNEKGCLQVWGVEMLLVSAY